PPTRPARELRRGCWRAEPGTGRPGPLTPERGAGTWHETPMQGRNGLPIRVASALNGLAGVWLILAPFILRYEGRGAAMWNQLLVGAVVVVRAVTRFFPRAAPAALSWANVALGAWLVAAPAVLGYTAHPAPLWNEVLVGAAVLGLGAWAALVPSNPRPA